MKTRGTLYRNVVFLLALSILAVSSLTGYAAATPKVLLLLHGMNSSPNTWNDFVASQFSRSSNKGILRGGVLVTSKPTANSRGVYCYAVEFGFYDKGILDEVEARTGLEDVSATNATLPTAGDFSSFATLGREVDEATKYLLTAHPRAQITLLAHSRGGVAAREFLQNTVSSTQKASVISMLTTGSPHKGSRLGRIYNWLETHPRGSAGSANDWTIVDRLVSQYSFDVRRPVISDLADDGAPIPALNGAVGNMKSAMTYGNLRYTITDLGYLGRQWGISYSVFNGINIPLFIYIPPLSAPAKEFILGVGKTPANYRGDGIVEGASQNLLDLAGRPSFSKMYDLAYTKSVYHTEELATGQVMDMTTALKYLTGWWK